MRNFLGFEFAAKVRWWGQNTGSFISLVFHRVKGLKV
jgi:hypothetical protein